MYGFVVLGLDPRTFLRVRTAAPPCIAEAGALGRRQGETIEGRMVEKLDPDQLQFVEILARLMAEHEMFKEEYSEQDFEAVVTWLRKLRSQIDITIETLEGQARPDG